MIGNRDPNVDDGLRVLEGDREWDVIIDNSGYVPRHVRASAELLKGRCRRYLYISTVAVYDFDSAVDDFSESGPLAPLADKSVEEVTGATYGPLKAECDRIVRDVLGEAVTVVRPTYILGPGDTTDRFTYWVERIHRGGKVLGPSHRELSVSGVDVRDLTDFVFRAVEKDIRGSFNAAGPTYSREGMLWAIRGTTSEPVHFHWATPELIEELGLSMPMMGGGRKPKTTASWIPKNCFCRRSMTLKMCRSVPHISGSMHSRKASVLLIRIITLRCSSKTGPGSISPIGMYRSLPGSIGR